MCGIGAKFSERRHADTFTFSAAVWLFDGLTASFGLGPLGQSLASRMKPCASASPGQVRGCACLLVAGLGPHPGAALRIHKGTSRSCDHAITFQPFPYFLLSISTRQSLAASTCSAPCFHSGSQYSLG